MDKAVSGEMAAFREQWEVELDELETESAHLLVAILNFSLYAWKYFFLQYLLCLRLVVQVVL